MKTGEWVNNFALHLMTFVQSLIVAENHIVYINVKKLTSLNLVLRTTITTPVKPQISKLKADKILPSGLQRVMAALLMSVY
jgi:hypothetical protein